MAPNNSLFSDSIRLTARVIRERWFVLLLFFVASATVMIHIEDRLIGLGSQSDRERILFALIGALADIADSFVLLLLLSWTMPRVHPLTGPQFLKEPFNREYLTTFVAESLRVLGYSMLWALALIIPGLVRYIQFSFVPMIVFFSREYEDGNVDALALSIKMVNRRWKLIFSVMLTLGILALALQLGPSRYAELHTMPIRVSFYLVGTLLSIWSYCLIFLVFEQEMKK